MRPTINCGKNPLYFLSECLPLRHKHDRHFHISIYTPLIRLNDLYTVLWSGPIKLGFPYNNKMPILNQESCIQLQYSHVLGCSEQCLYQIHIPIISCTWCSELCLPRFKLV